MNIGDKLIDNDPRMVGRVLTIKALGLRNHRGIERVVAVDKTGRSFGISTARIYADGKPRKSGFTLEAE